MVKKTCLSHLTYWRLPHRGWMHWKDWVPPLIKSYDNSDHNYCKYMGLHWQEGLWRMVVCCLQVCLSEFAPNNTALFFAVWFSRQLGLKSVSLFASGGKYWTVIMAGRLSFLFSYRQVNEESMDTCKINQCIKAQFKWFGQLPWLLSECGAWAAVLNCVFFVS